VAAAAVLPVPYPRSGDPTPLEGKKDGTFVIGDGIFEREK